jgi:hypothetical protein
VPHFFSLIRPPLGAGNLLHGTEIDSQAANYRQTVLTGFQQVEDNLAAVRILENEAKIQDEAVVVAQHSLDLSVTRYKGGVTSYLEVITAQNAALADELTAVNIFGRRMANTVLLIQALEWRMGPIKFAGATRMLRQAGEQQRQLINAE